MSDISLIDKINLRNKYLDKIIKNFKEVNRSLELLNNVNKKINRQYGGTFNDITTQAKTMTSDIQTTITNTETQINLLDASSEKIVTGLDNIIDTLLTLPINSGTKFVTNEDDIKAQIDNMITKI